MKKSIVRALSWLMAVSALFVAVSCDNEEENEGNGSKEEALYYRYWISYPNSYIKMCDWRMTFRFTKCHRVDGGLEIGYVLTNTGFDKKVKVSFWMPESAGHDDLGNTYICTSSIDNTSVVPMIDGHRFGTSGNGYVATFMPNQTVKGSFMIKGFDPNALAVSISCRCRLLEPSDELFMYENIEFVNMPVDSIPDNPVYM